jgi:MoaA/NifB/PqqE/SkfB family radical SAM enzyme
LRRLVTPEGLFIHDRDSGFCIFTPEIRSKTWTKPLYAQIAITEKCNLHCPFCYLSSSPNKEKMWNVEELMELVKFLDSWGLLGIALGGGEPFMHPKLCEIVRRTWKETGLDVSITTNGFASTEKQIEQIEGYVSEVRVSIRTPEDCVVLERFLGRKCDLGVNLLLMRGNASLIEELVEKCTQMGIRDFLVNSFLAVGRGAQHKDWEPRKADLAKLCRIIEKYRGRAVFKVSGRLASELKNHIEFEFIPFMDERRGRIIAVTADKKVKPSSLSQEVYAFSEPEEIPEVYTRFIRGGQIGAWKNFEETTR